MSYATVASRFNDQKIFFARPLRNTRHFAISSTLALRVALANRPYISTASLHVCSTPSIVSSVPVFLTARFYGARRSRSCDLIAMPNNMQRRRVRAVQTPPSGSKKKKKKKECFQTAFLSAPWRRQAASGDAILWTSSSKKRNFARASCPFRRRSE